MLNGFGPGCEDTKLYGSNVQSQGGAGNEKMGDGDWVLERRRRRMDEQVWYVLYCTVQVTMYIIS